MRRSRGTGQLHIKHGAYCRWRGADGHSHNRRIRKGRSKGEADGLMRAQAERAARRLVEREGAKPSQAVDARIGRTASRCSGSTSRRLRDAEQDLARQAEHAYTQTMRDRQATGAIKAGATATPGRASQNPLGAKPRGKPQAPDVCASLRQSLPSTDTIPQEPTPSKPPLTFIRRRKAARRLGEPDR